MKKLHFILILVLFSFVGVFGQTDIGPDTRINVPGDWGKRADEFDPVIQDISPVPQTLLNQYNEAVQSGNEAEKERLGKETDRYLKKYASITDNAPIQVKSNENGAPEPQWGIGDIKVHSGSIRTIGFRQIDMKFAEDGNLYLAVNRTGVSGYNGYITIYRSTDGGRHWLLVSNVAHATYYFGQITMLVEKRHASLDDSTRVIVYLTASSSSNMDNAIIGYATMRRNGTGFYSAWIANPPGGMKYQYPTSCSDGMYYTTLTYMHFVVRLDSNSGKPVQLIHFRTTDWCLTHTSAEIITGFNDYYPSCAYSKESSGTDSIYIAIERRFTNVSEIRVIVTPAVPSTNFRTYYLTTAYGTTKYEKPCITVPQQASGVPRKILITCVKDSVNRVARYHYSTNSGASWNVNFYLGTTIHQTDYTWCNSDSLETGGGYLIATYVDVNGDSVNVRRGVPGSMGTVLYKRNSYPASGILTPVVAIYKEGTTKYSTFAYPGYGPTNVYFNAENLPAVGVKPIGTSIPDKYELSQNYPNPFNPVTNIEFKLMNSGFVSLKIYDLLGREVQNLINEYMNAGAYSISFDASNLNSGIYIYRLNVNGFSDTKKMILVK